MSSSTTQITASCACGRNSLAVSFPNSSLPIDRALCLCDSCRRLTGSCGISYITVPPTTHVDLSSFSLTDYSTSDDLTRYFCSTCGAHFFCRRREGGTWHLATGLWDRTEGVIRWTGSKWVEDTLDGGVSVWLKEIEDADGTKRALNSWMLRDGPTGNFVSPGSFTTAPKQKKKAEGEEEKLKAQCHCGGVKFYITKPNEASKKVQSPFPDLMVPYCTGVSSANSANETWWLRDNDTKYLAGTCTCKSCRLASGMEIQPWTFVPKCNIFQENGKPMDYGIGTLKRFEREEGKGIWREFCAVCGATVFWHCEERSNLIDVSVGLLDPEEGARVEGWLDWWTERVSFEEMAVSKNLVRALEDGLKKWGKTRKEA